jgi:hypothetical protein
MQKGYKENKGLPCDGSHDGFYKNASSQDLKDFWNDRMFQQYKYAVGETRLVKLSKAKGNKIPRYNEFRPLLLSGGMFKWLESRFKAKLD